MARPKPECPPVMMAIFPVKSGRSAGVQFDIFNGTNQAVLVQEVGGCSQYREGVGVSAKGIHISLGVDFVVLIYSNQSFGSDK